MRAHTILQSTQKLNLDIPLRVKTFLTLSGTPIHPAVSSEEFNGSSRARAGAMSAELQDLSDEAARWQGWCARGRCEKRYARVRPAKWTREREA